MQLHGCDVIDVDVELTESDVVISLCSLREDKFAYSLINGEVGVYGGSERFWRIKVSSRLR